MKEFFIRNIADFVFYLELGMLFTIALGMLIPSLGFTLNPIFFLALILLDVKLDVKRLQKKGDD